MHHPIGRLVVHVDDGGDGEGAAHRHLGMVIVTAMVMVTWWGKAVTWWGKVVMVTLWPAPVTRGAGPGGRSPESSAPLVMCRSNRPWGGAH